MKRISKTILVWIALVVAVTPLTAQGAEQGIAINLDLAKASQLTAAAKANGIDLVPGSLNQISTATGLVVLGAA